MRTLSYDRIIARAKNHIFGDMTGSNISKKEGDGYDFAQIRAHTYGDNVKRIDWKKSSKTNELQQRVFFEEKEVLTHVIGLLNGSMHFGIAQMKQTVLAEVIALLGFSSVRNGDLFSISLFDEKLILKTAIGKKESSIRGATKKAFEFPLIGKKLNWDTIEKHMFSHFKKPSLVFIIGDFFDIPKLNLISKKHTVILIMIRDHFEEKPTKVGSVLVRDPISLKEERVVLDESFVKEYTKKQKLYDSKLEDYLKKYAVRWVKIYTNEDPFKKLSSIFKAY
ncbi:DUF58 domain-containing protein [Sulfurospirillum arcachonense]|uniref:DUF58 domain-containing protein n=1 Tax=Sulfurospirillum arcachonense TaxID=57666 RepID=UPI0004698989|nr:DUF58 domain-containing protein [Sulfurospirillum arcachonense]